MGMKMRRKMGMEMGKIMYKEIKISMVKVKEGKLTKETLFSSVFQACLCSLLIGLLLTPAKTLSISGLKSRVLKLPFFNLKMRMKIV